MKVEVEVPEGCRLVSVSLQAETREAFEAAAEDRQVFKVGPNATSDRVYTVWVCNYEDGGLSYNLRSPERVQRVVDA